MKDLYAGTLLSDMSQEDKENIDKPKMQSLDDLLKSLDEDEEDNLQLHGDNDMEEEEEVESLLDNLVDEEEDIVEDEE